MSDREPFFLPAPRPEDEPEREPFYPDFAWMRPDNVVAADVPLGIELARTDETVLRLTRARAFGRGLQLEVEWWIRPGSERRADHSHGWEEDEWPRFGVQLGDGTRLGREFAAHGGGADPAEGGPGLTQCGGSGGGLRGGQDWWLHPMPTEDFEVVVAWPSRGIDEAWRRIELAPLRAARDEVIWPMPPMPESEDGSGFGWFAYAPLSGAVHGAPSPYTSALDLGLDQPFADTTTDGGNAAGEPPQLEGGRER
jgi:hypothetical protein